MEKWGNLKIYISSGIILLFTIALYYLSVNYFWSSDSYYFALRFEMDDTDPYRKMNDAADLISSQCAHYMNWSGRFFCQTIVQIFCAFTTRPTFEICNAIVWLIFIVLLMKLAEVRLTDAYKVFLLTSISFLIFLTLPLDPPFLINYLWMGCVVTGWLYMFKTTKFPNKAGYIAALIFSIISGNTQEAYTIPLSAAVFILLILKKIKLSKFQQVCTAGFFVGTLLLVIAPGNYVRLLDSPGLQQGIFRNLYTAIPQIMLTILIISISISNKRLFSQKALIPKIILTGTPFSILLGAIMGFNNFSRILIPMNIMLLTATVWSDINRHSRLSAIIIASICVGAFFSSDKYIRAANLKISLISADYHQSVDGRIYLPDAIFCIDTSGKYYYEEGFAINERINNPHKPPLKIHAQSLEKLLNHRDSASVMQIAPQAWVISTNISDSEEFVVVRTLLPGFLDIKLPDRILNMGTTGDIVIDTIDNRATGYYFNRKWYMKSAVSCRAI